MIYTPKIFDSVVNNDLCIGCGLCVYKCPEKALEMKWDEKGFLIPELVGNCDGNSYCLSACPFNPFPQKEIESEDEIAKLFLADAPLHHPKIGKYNSVYVGYSKAHRPTSSSGGIASYILNELLDKGIVDHVFSVKESKKPGYHYEYGVSSTKEELLAGSKTRYFPVTLATVLPEIHKLKGKIAIVGVGCFIKGIRLAQNIEPELREKIPFLVGIICGGVKSRFFTEFLSGKTGIGEKNYRNPEYRIKDVRSTAADYSFGCSSKISGQEEKVKMREVGEMWGTGLFKANACDFCDDVTTELADISVGDAWLDPFVKDGKGTSLVVTRTIAANNIIKDGIKNKKLKLKDLPLEKFLLSQKGSFNHRHIGLPVRIKLAEKAGKLVPPKRYNKGSVPILFQLVQFFRMRVRRKSLHRWRENPQVEKFDKIMSGDLLLLRVITKFYHLKINFFFKKINKKKFYLK